MKIEIKSSILILMLFFGYIATQSQEIANSAANPSASVSGSGISGSASGSGRPPKGKGKPGKGFGMRGKDGKRPDGPRNLPPKNGGYSDKLAAITDEKIFQVKNVLRYLPLVEQDLLAGIFLFFKLSFFFITIKL